MPVHLDVYQYITEVACEIYIHFCLYRLCEINKISTKFLPLTIYRCDMKHLISVLSVLKSFRKEAVNKIDTQQVVNKYLTMKLSRVSSSLVWTETGDWVLSRVFSTLRNFIIDSFEGIVRHLASISPSFGIIFLFFFFFKHSLDYR